MEVSRNAKCVGDEKTEDDGPENVVNLGNQKVMFNPDRGQDVLNQFTQQADAEEKADTRKRGEGDLRYGAAACGDWHRNCLRGHGSERRFQNPALHCNLLEADLMNDVKTNKRGKRQGNRNSQQVHIDRKPLSRSKLVIEGCHKTPSKLLHPGSRNLWAKRRAHISRSALIRGLLKI